MSFAIHIGALGADARFVHFDSITMHFAFFEITFEQTAIGILYNTLAMQLIALPLTDVFITVFTTINALANTLAMLPLAFVGCYIIPGINAESMLLASKIDAYIFVT